jgi:Sec-independent protein translocase protein TatA
LIDDVHFTPSHFGTKHLPSVAEGIGRSTETEKLKRENKTEANNARGQAGRKTKNHAADETASQLRFFAARVGV